MMTQQQLGALALIALGVVVAAGSGSAALRRHLRRGRGREPLWSRLLAALATVGLVAGLVSMGAYYYGPPLAQGLWLARVAVGGFTAAVVGYAVTITPTLWRALWAD
jgi:hypothetical protein